MARPNPAHAHGSREALRQQRSREPHTRGKNAQTYSPSDAGTFFPTSGASALCILAFMVCAKYIKGATRPGVVERASKTSYAFSRGSSGTFFCRSLPPRT